jgi:hypothetical protein
MAVSNVAKHEVRKHVDHVQGFMEAARESIAHSALRSELEERPGDPEPYVWVHRR